MKGGPGLVKKLWAYAYTYSNGQYALCTLCVQPCPCSNWWNLATFTQQNEATKLLVCRKIPQGLLSVTCQRPLWALAYMSIKNPLSFVLRNLLLSLDQPLTHWWDECEIRGNCGWLYGFTADQELKNGLHIWGLFALPTRWSAEVCNLSAFSHLKVLISPLFLERKQRPGYIPVTIWGDVCSLLFSATPAAALFHSVCRPCLQN